MSKWNYGLDKTYSNASEAFRDADYATPIWKCETELSRTLNYLANWTVAGCTGCLLAGFIYLMTKFLP